MNTSRRIERSRSGRLNWQPHQPHPLDILFEDAQTAQEQVLSHLQALQATASQLMAQLTAIQDQEASARLAHAETTALEALERRFASCKHAKHLNAHFLTLRRQRLAARLQAAQAALDLAAELLSTEESFFVDQLATLVQASPAAAPSEMTKDGEGSEIASPGTTAPSAQEFTVPSPEELGSVELARAALNTFERRLPALRAALIRRTGHIEQYKVWKRAGLKPAVKALLQALQRARKADRSLDSLPPSLVTGVDPELATYLLTHRITTASAIPDVFQQAAFDFKAFGPYWNYRWKEGTHHYCIPLSPRRDNAFFPFTPNARAGSRKSPSS